MACGPLNDLRLQKQQHWETVPFRTVPAATGVARSRRISTFSVAGRFRGYPARTRIRVKLLVVFAQAETGGFYPGSPKCGCFRGISAFLTKTSCCFRAGRTARYTEIQRHGPSGKAVPATDHAYFFLPGDECCCFLLEFLFLKCGRRFDGSPSSAGRIWHFIWPTRRSMPPYGHIRT